MDAREATQIAEQVFDAKKYRIRTHVIAQVVAYDAATNTASVQPVTKAIRLTDPENITTVQLPQISEVPVLQRGSGKLWLTVAPAVDSYGLLHISDRIIDDWLAAGGIVEPTGIRCHDLSDAIFEPSLLHLVDEGDNGLLAEAVATDRISLRTRTNLTEISVLDDETVYINVSDGKATLTIDTDGNVTLVANGDITAETTGGDALIKAAKGKVTTSSGETVIQDGADWAVQYTALKSAFDTLKNDFNNFINITYNLHMHPTAAIGAPSVPTVIGTPTAADMTGAKVTDVRLP